eukprot:SAG31_NODE_632_length_13389_cov_4.818360_13_plen_99_part_00
MGSDRDPVAVLALPACSIILVSCVQRWTQENSIIDHGIETLAVLACPPGPARLNSVAFSLGPVVVIILEGCPATSTTNTQAHQPVRQLLECAVKVAMV